MSCHVVSNKHISAILGGANRYRSEYIESHNFDPATVGQMLLDANCRSVDARYYESASDDASGPDGSEVPNETEVFKLDQIAFNNPLNPIPTAKLIDCLMYQSCEGKDWEESEAHKWLTKVKLQIISHNPEWFDAAWSI